MATTTETKEEKEDGEDPTQGQDLVQVWVYIQDFKAPHPVYGGTQIRARAVNQFGREVAELYADSVEAIKEQGAALHEPGTRVVFVENPDAHPLLSKILASEQAQAERVEEQKSAPKSLSKRDRAPMEAMRSEHHLCAVCACREVCTLANLSMTEEQLVTVASCLSFVPEPDGTDEKTA